MFILILLLIQSFTCSIDDLYYIKFYAIRQVVWKNENEILLVQTRHLRRKGDYREGGRDPFYNNQRVVKYEIKEKKMLPTHNVNFDHTKEYVIGERGNRILCLDFTASTISIYDNNKVLYNKAIKELNLDSINGVYFIDDNFAYLYYYVQGKVNVVKLNYRTGKFVILDKDICFIPQRIILSKPDDILFSSDNQILGFYSNNNNLKEHYLVNNKWEFWRNIGILNGELFFEAKKPGKSSVLFIYNIQNAKIREFPYYKKFNSVFVSKKFIIFVRVREVKGDSSNESTAEYLLFDHSGKLKWKKKLSFMEAEFLFPSISPSEEKIGFWTISGKINIYNIGSPGK